MNEEITDTAFGTYIKSARIALGLSQKALAQKAGWSKSYICDIEKGRKHSFSSIKVLAEALDLKYDYLSYLAGYFPEQERTSKALDQETFNTAMQAFRDKARNS